MKPVTDHGADVGFDFGVRADSDGGEDPKALLLQIPENRTGLLYIVSVRPGAVGIVEDGGGAHQTADLIQPALCIRLHPLQRGGREIDMSPCMASERPAGALELGDDGLHRLPLLLPVGLQLIIPHLRVRVGAVA